MKKLLAITALSAALFFGQTAVAEEKAAEEVKPSHVEMVLVLDESGSMMDSVIHSAVMAGIFARLPVMDVKLVIFDTSVVDLSGYVEDPVETLMSIQLGGGTDIGGALRYCETLIENHCGAGIRSL